MPALSVLILTEDSSPSAHETWTKLARKLLQLVEEHTRTNHVHFQPAEQATRLGVRANLWKSWKSPNPRDQRPLRNLRRRLANKVLEDRVPGYVLFHFDGDRPWSESDSCENGRKFEEFKQSLRSEVEDNLRARNLPSDTAAVDERLSRICPATPFYSIESWLYQSTQRLRELCQQRCGKHLELIAEWEADRARLEEVLKPKEKLCIGSRNNPELAESFTRRLAEDLYLLGQSFHATVERLQLCPGLQAALRATWDPTPREAPSSTQAP